MKPLIYAISLALVICTCACAPNIPTSPDATTVAPTAPSAEVTESPSPSPTPTATPTPSPTAAPATEAPTEDITPTPEITATPTETPATPTKTPAPSTLPAPETPDSCDMTLSITPYGLPSEDVPVYESIGFNMRAVLSGQNPILNVTVTVTDSKGKSYSCSVNFDAADNVTQVDFTADTLTQLSIDSYALTDKLYKGKCLISVYALDSTLTSPALLYSSYFTKISDSKTYILSPNNFRSYFYYSCLDFFKSEEEFLFKFKNDDGRYITQDSQWTKKYLTTVKNWLGKNMTVHKAAAPYFEMAYEYIDTTLLRVRSDSFDSGVIPLKEVAAVSYGTYVSRFVSGKRFISHHALGTAQDINAAYPSNTNDINNRYIIASEVALLQYEGIKTDAEGRDYHSFVYNGECTDIRGGVPETISNYLVYELGYFRAGFGWGYYYDHTCDAMHFSLTELPTSLHEAENGGLRKVYEYIN